TQVDRVKMGLQRLLTCLSSKPPPRERRQAAHMVAVCHTQLITQRSVALGPFAFESRDPAGDADPVAILAGQIYVAEQLGWSHPGQLVDQTVVGIWSGPLLAPEHASRDIGDRERRSPVAHINRGQQ